MSSEMNNKSTLTILTVFAVAMANLEAAVVVYMRQLYYASNPLEIFPLQFLNSYDTVLELSREAATVVMILTVALLVSFLQPAVAVLITEGVDELSGFTPGNFWWWLFVPGYLLMTCGLGMTLRGATEGPSAGQRAFVWSD